MNRYISTLVLCTAALFCNAGLDNSSLIPPFKTDAQVGMEKTADGKSESPDWVKGLIMTTARVDAVSTDQTLKGMEPYLDHLAEMGVNGLWVTPPLNGGNGYGNFGIHTMNPLLLGEKDPVKQWQILKNFVDAAHKRNIRVFFDIVTWGVTKHEGGAPIFKEKPEWFSQISARYAGWYFNWDNAELNEWFASRLIEWALLTGADGFRCDCSPFHAEYGAYRTAKKRLRDMGRKIILISEFGCARRNVFDFDQVSMMKDFRTPRWQGVTFLEKNIVDEVKNGGELIVRDDETALRGRKRFYTFMLSCHDSQEYTAKGSPIVFGYQTIFSPFIPLWYVGEEWNNPKAHFIDYYVKRDKIKRKSWRLYNNFVDWKARDKNRAFFEQVKKMIRIRRERPEIFEFFPDNNTQTNICAVKTQPATKLQSYARYRNGKAVIIVPNYSSELLKTTVSIPFAEGGLKKDREYTVTDLLSDKQISSGKNPDFSITLNPGELGVFEVK